MVTRPGTLEVGFMEGATYPDGTSIPLVAALNEFGRPSKGQPPRPFMRPTVDEGERHWAGDLAAVLRQERYDAPRALDLMGVQITAEIQQTIFSVMGPPLAASTVAAKGFDKPLIHHRDMVNAVTHRVKT